MANRPSNWYQMSYTEQQDWTRNERQHQRELDDKTDEIRRAEEDASRERQSFRRSLESKDGTISDLQSDLDGRYEAIERACELLQTIVNLDDKNPGSLERAKAIAGEALKELRQ